jgi:beta-lactamase superfamily II metal-dependent hydrolase
MSILLLADSRPEIIAESLRSNGFSEVSPLKVDYVKISHHGSMNNTSQDQLGLISSGNFIISTNGGTATHKHPSRETLARIIFSSQRSDQSIKIYFNYKIEDLKSRMVIS